MCELICKEKYILIFDDDNFYLYVLDNILKYLIKKVFSL